MSDTPKAAPAPKMVPVWTNEGELSQVPEDKYDAALKYGGIRPASEAEVKEHFARQDAGENPGRAFARGVGRALTFGGSDYLEKSLLGTTEEELRYDREENPIASPAGEVVTDVATMFIPGGAALKAAKLAKMGKVAAGASEAARVALNVSKIPVKAGEAVARTIERAGAGSTKGIAKFLSSKPVARTAGSAVEGAIYGARQAVTEDAIGNTDLSAESLIHNAGLGALLGGATSGSLEVLGAGMRSLGRTGAEVTKKLAKAETLEQAANKEAFSALKPTAKQVDKFRGAPAEDMGQWLRDNKAIKYGTTADDIAKTVSKREEIVAPRIKQIYQELDNSATPKPDANSIYSRVYREVVAPLENDSFQRALAQKVKNALAGFKDDYVRPGAVKAEVGYQKLWDMQRTFDKTINHDNPLETGLNAELKKVRNIFRETLQGGETQVAKELVPELKALNKEYATMKRIEKLVKSVVNTQEAAAGRGGLFDKITSVGGAVGGMAMGGPIGGAIGYVAGKVGNKLLQERGKIVSAAALDDLAKLGKLERGQNSTLGQIKDAVTGFFDGAKRAAVPTTVDTTFGFLRGAKADKKETREEASVRRINEVRDLVASPEHLATTFAERTRNLQDVAPNTTMALQQAMLRAASFLNEKLPKDPRMGESITPLVQSNWRPTGSDIAKAMRYIRAVENPKHVLADIKNGQVSVEAMDALKEVYPQIHAEVVGAVIDAASRRKKPLSYTQKVQLSLITGAPIDPSMNPKFIKAMQKTYAGIYKQMANNGRKSGGGAGIPAIAAASMTPGQRIGMK